MAEQQKGNGSTAQEAQAQAQPPRINWDDSNMRSSYANVCNATGTREEVVLFFGISHPSQSQEPGVRVQLNERVILSPFAAKRLALLLNNVIRAYEERFGALPLGEQQTPLGTGKEG